MYVWMNPEKNPQTDKEYYVYVLVYLDYFIHPHHDPEIFTKELKGIYVLKCGILGPPTIYLGSNVENGKMEDGSIALSNKSK